MILSLQGGVKGGHTRQPACTPQNTRSFRGFPSTRKSFSPRDSEYSVVCRVQDSKLVGLLSGLIEKTVWRCQSCCVDFTDTDSKQRDGPQGEAMGMGRGQQPSSLLIPSDLDAPVCQGEGRCKQFGLPPGCSI